MKIEDLKKLKEPLPIECIDFRIQSINKGGYATILAYKDARVDMNRLDDVCGQSNWQRDHKEIKNVVYCGIGINVITENNQVETIWKWDAGSESFTEKQKGEASDSFKRAGFNWGIGRELYDYPLIQIKLNADEFRENNGKMQQTYVLQLKTWRWHLEYEDGAVKRLACKDNNGRKRFDYIKPKLEVKK